MAAHHLCPVALAGMLDNRFRRWLQDPVPILRPYLREGLTALDLGCGPGFFTVEMARMVGPGGRVIACDLQPGMLARLGRKIAGSALAPRITLHRSGERQIGWPGQADFILAFYVIHEIADQQSLFTELGSILQPGGRLLMVEPLLHVPARAFARTLALAEAAGFRHDIGPRIVFSRTAVLSRG
jgi:ubiquinone/menaquinone biosynthesis C-methylase UbiE